MKNRVCILGAGATGLAVGMESGFPVFEASDTPGGICSSYYMSRDGVSVSHIRRPDEEDYRFEIGGGHWIFGGDDDTIRFMESLVPMKKYLRKSSVWLSKRDIRVPFPIQYHLSRLPASIRDKAFAELLSTGNGKASVLKEFVSARFGPTLANLFFEPFHKAYTAGLYDRIAPQDEYKSPLDLELVRKGYNGDDVTAGYNVRFRYPSEGLGTLFQRMAGECDVRYGYRVIAIDLDAKELKFSNGESIRFETVVSTLPLSAMTVITGLKQAGESDPYTSVLVVNIGGRRGPQCPDHHWMYVPDANSGFYRVGFYSNVDMDFLPRTLRVNGGFVSIYAEKAFVGGTALSEQELRQHTQAIVEDLIAWKFLESTEVVHPTWIDVGYTWRIHGSRWKDRCLELLESHSIHQAGRYARWSFQGIAESIREGREVARRIRGLAQ